MQKGLLSPRRGSQRCGLPRSNGGAPGEVRIRHGYLVIMVMIMIVSASRKLLAEALTPLF